MCPPYLLAMATILGVPACGAPQLVKGTTAVHSVPAAWTLPDVDENRLGRRLEAYLAQGPLHPSLDRALLDRVAAVAHPVLEQARRLRGGLAWDVHVFDGPEDVNVFAAPGGGLYVRAALVEATAEDAHLAGMLAHAAGHAVAGHPARALAAALGERALRDPEVSPVAQALAGREARLSYGGHSESEAGAWAARLAVAAGLDGRALAGADAACRRGAPGWWDALAHPEPW